MKSFMFQFSGWLPGWVGPSSIYTITVNGATKEDALYALAQKYKIEKVKTVRELGLPVVAPAKRQQVVQAKV